MSQKQQQQKLEIELTKEESTGTYSNLVMITHSSAEFIFDFIAVMPGLPKAMVQKRLILTPEHAKRFAGALNENIRRYEEMHGVIKESKTKPEQGFHFRGPLPEA